jgi:hypothetical protein
MGTSALHSRISPAGPQTRDTASPRQKSSRVDSVQKLERSISSGRPGLRHGCTGCSVRWSVRDARQLAPLYGSIATLNAPAACRDRQWPLPQISGCDSRPSAAPSKAVGYKTCAIPGARTRPDALSGFNRVANMRRSSVRPQQQGARRQLHSLHGTTRVIPLPAQTLHNPAKREPLLRDQSVAIRTP